MNEEKEQTVFPCDLPRWPEIKKLLLSIRGIPSSEAWITSLQKAHNIALSSDQGGGDPSATGAKSKTRNIFNGLRVFLEFKASAGERDQCLNVVLPHIVDRAIEIEYIRPHDVLEIFLKQKGIRHQLYCFIIIIVVVVIIVICNHIIKS